MKGFNRKLIALCACALFLFGCEKEDDALDTLEVKESGTNGECDVITFEGYSGYITQVNSEGGFGPILVNNTARNSAGNFEGGNRARIFNSGAPTGDDTDLAADWGNVLIIQNLLVEDVPDDNTWGGQMLLTFPEPVTVTSLRVLDIDEYEDASFVYLLDENDVVLDSEQLQPLGDNSEQTVIFNGTEGIDGVVTIRVVLNGDGEDLNIVGSGAIDNIAFCVPEEEVTGCTRTQGYWKNHADPSRKQYDAAWDDYLNLTFFNSGQTYLQVLQTPPKEGNEYYILAHQYIAAILNIESGASTPDEVDDAIEGAEAYFNGGAASRAQLLEWAEILDDYNNGLIGPGSCDE